MALERRGARNGVCSCVPRGLKPDLVVEGLYLSSCATEECLDALQQSGITHILQAGAGLWPTHPGRFTYLSLPLYDKASADLVSCLPEALAFIDGALNAGGRVLVHCQAGVSRSPSVVAAHLMTRKGMTLAAALATTQAARRCILPNPGFLCQLLHFEAAGHDAAGWPGWGYGSWLGSPLAARAQQMHDELLGWSPGGGGGGGDEGAAEGEGGGWCGAVGADLVNEAAAAASSMASPFAAAAAAAAAAAGEEGVE
ncbi:MAG: protein-tyrosine phosphatase-like protein [Monoraphidium minutum]|nr:MAG: protein-tyrosine phosphatase-like protein [Monoraphidium minutum]